MEKFYIYQHGYASKEQQMHRKFILTLLIFHIFFMMFVVSYNCKFDFTNNGMILVYTLFFFAPGIYCAIAHFIFLIKERNNKKIPA